MKSVALILLALLPAAPPQTRTEQPKPPPSDARQKGQADSSGGGQEEVDEGDVLRIRTSLVTVPVAAADSKGRYVSGLRTEDFQVIEDGVEQDISFFADAEQPLAVVLLIDTSVSVGSSWRAIGRAVEDFVAQLRPKDTVLPIAFDSTIRVPLARSTSDHALLLATLRGMLSRPSEGNGATRLFDVVDLVNKHLLPSAKGVRKVVLVFSDGIDSGSRVATLKGTLNDAEEVGALYYTLCFHSSGAAPISDFKMRSDVNAATRQGEEYLRALADKTGGRFIGVDGRYPALTRETFRVVAQELRHLYSLGYYPKNKAASTRRRQIRVKVKGAGVKAQGRKSYVYESPGR